MKNKTIPQRIIDILRVRPCTAVQLCRLIHQEEPTQKDIASMHVHIHRAGLIAPIAKLSTYDGRKEKGRPAVVYSVEQAR